ncbi:hypothetical protein DFJ73DRAFT_620068 [Zopfochytrium polystomum]|nr:hypothetical protein DFJ73DRAFT_620068 [Zopfochytrium polystomum]
MISTEGPRKQQQPVILGDSNVASNAGGANVRILFAPGITGTYSLLWLRDNCQCPRCVHPENRQKLHSSADVSGSASAKSIAIIDGSAASAPAAGPVLRIEWAAGSLRHDQSGHVTEVPLLWLVQTTRHPSTHPALADSSEVGAGQSSAPIIWDAAMVGRAPGLSQPYAEFMETESGLWAVVQQLHRFGLCFLRGVPTEDKAVEKVARRFGCIRETFYGTSWDVKSVPQARNIAYTALDLGLHMDLLYFEAPPGLQFLHSLKNSVTGGESIFMDSFRAVQILRSQHPQDYEILKRVPVTFHYQNDGHSMRFRRPTISDDDPTDGLKVYYSPPFQGPLEIEDPNDVGPFYSAFQRFADILESPGLVYRTRLEPGDCAVFLNRRVLHGRAEFDPASGERHFKGTYVDIDDFKDRFNVLSAKAV